MVASSSSVSISCFKVQSSIGHLVWFFDNGNSLVTFRFFSKKLAKLIKRRSELAFGCFGLLLALLDFTWPL